MSLPSPYQWLTTSFSSNPTSSLMFSNNKIPVNKSFASVIAFASHIDKTVANIN